MASEGGHKPRAVFFFVPQVEPSPGPTFGNPFDCAVVAVIVPFEDAVDAVEEDDPVRCMVLRGMNILLTSSAVGARPFEAPLGALHPGLETD